MLNTREPVLNPGGHTVGYSPGEMFTGSETFFQNKSQRGQTHWGTVIG